MTDPAASPIDLRPLSPDERVARILESLDSLASASDLVLIGDGDPRPILLRLQAERGGRFDWSPLEEGSELWRIRIHWRGAASSAREVNEYMAWDHDRLDALLVKAADALSAGDGTEGRRLFGEFRTGLLRHIRMEEEVLFPAFERATGMAQGGPTDVMRREHREIQRILEAMLACLTGSENASQSFEPLRQSLLGVLVEHNAKEERVIYPLTDRQHTAEERDRIVREMQSI